MRTMIRGGYVVAFDGREHRLLRDGVVVFEDDRVTHVGKSFDGSVDRIIDARGKLVSPGFINIHALTSICITHFRIDGGSAGMLRFKDELVAGLKHPRGWFEGEDLRTSALFGFAELLKGGATTIVDITAFGSSGFQPPREEAEAYVKTAGELGARAYISHPYENMKSYRNESGGSDYYFDEEAGLVALAEAIRFSKEFEGTYDDRIRTMLFPYRFDSCSAELLRETKRAAVERDLPIHQHFSQSLREYYDSIRRYGKTPIQYLYDTGFLGPKVILTHTLYTSNNPQSPTSVWNDSGKNIHEIELLAKTGTTVGHTPMIWGRMGVLLHSFGEYMRAGVNMAIGTDAFPMDMIMEMRNAAILGKVAERNRLAVTARDVFNAATLGGAKALGRDDLGRLALGAKADIVVVDLRGLHVALVDDPIKTLVYMASQNDIETVIVDGRIVVEGGRVPGVDEEELASKANELNQRWKREYETITPSSFQAA